MIVGFIIVGVVIGAFILSYVLNARTPKPEGCIELDCHGCADAFCSHNPAHQKSEMEEKNEIRSNS